MERNYGIKEYKGEKVAKIWYTRNKTLHFDDNLLNHPKQKEKKRNRRSGNQKDK